MSEQPTHDAAETEIDLSHIEMVYATQEGGIRALDTTDLAIGKGEFVVLLGPSGCGKTTLLRIIGGLIRPTAGQVTVSEHALWRGARRDDAAVQEMAMVFQDANLFPWLSIEDNIGLPLKLRGTGRAARQDRARELCRLVGIDGFERRWPRELSGGMRQRAAIARALSYNPNILLMDEPFGALDAMTRETMNLELQRIWMTSGCSVVLVTHSIGEAAFLADRIVLLTTRPGRIDRILKVPFPRPRDLDVTATGEFQDIVSGLRHRLEEIS